MKIQSEIIGCAREFLSGRGFTEILPVMISSVTDPLCHEVLEAKISYYDTEYYLMKSMIAHKQIALSYLDSFFSFSPNIRLETKDKRDTGRHLIEFTQLDLEVKDADRDEVIALGEILISHVIRTIAEKHKPVLDSFGRELSVPETPFERITYADAVAKYGKDFELALSKEAKGPVWLIDIPIECREFYDKEDPERPGTLLDMDLIYPEGYGEGMSGGEREHEYERIVERIEKTGLKAEDYPLYIDIAKKGLTPSAGFGFGIERLTRYVCGLSHVEETRLFPKKPGCGVAL